MITVYVLMTFYDDAGIHKAGTICKVKAENFDPRFMKKVKSPSEYVYSKTEVDEMLLKKQDSLTEGTGIDIDEDEVISCTVDPTSVSVTQVQTTGTKIATVTVNSVDTDLYAPNGGGSIDTTIIADDFDTEGTVTPPAGTLYMAGDVVKRSSNFYSCKNDNTQSGTWTASKWTQLTVATITAPGVSIDAGGYALDSDKLYRNDNQWGSSWFTPGNPPSGFTEINYTTYDTTPYSPGGTVYASYSVGDYCIYEDELYRCTGSTTGGTWDSTKWTKVQVMDEMPSVSVTQVQSTGTKIATVTVNSVGTDIYAPEGNPFIIAGAGGIEYIVYGQSFPNQIGFATAVDPSDLDDAIAAKRPVIIKFSDGIIALSNIYKDVDDKIKGSFVAGSNTSDGSTNTSRLKIITFQMREMNGNYVSMYAQDATPSGGGSSVTTYTLYDSYGNAASFNVFGQTQVKLSANGGSDYASIATIKDAFDAGKVILKDSDNIEVTIDAVALSDNRFYVKTYASSSNFAVWALNAQGGSFSAIKLPIG